MRKALTIQAMGWVTAAILCGAAGATAGRGYTWSFGPPLTLARSSACAVTAGSHLYVIGGGWSDPYTALTSAEHSIVGTDGRLSPWHLTSRTKTPRVFLACAELGGYLYAIGGERFANRQPILLNSVERAPVLPDGNLGHWEAVASLNTPRRAPAAVAACNAIYVIGGYNGTFLNTAERARRLPDGSLGPWEILKSKTVIPRYIHNGVLVKERIYLLGGHDEATGMATDRTEWTRILPDGGLAPWREGPRLDSIRFLSASAGLDGRILIFGGSTGRAALPTVEEIGINPDGSPGPVKPGGLLSGERTGAAIARHGRLIYLIGGLDHGEALASVEFTEVAR